MTTTSSARLFRIELRRNGTWALLPLLAGLLWLASPGLITPAELP
jgi:hypothetical protein